MKNVKIIIISFAILLILVLSFFVYNINKKEDKNKDYCNKELNILIMELSEELSNAVDGKVNQEKVNELKEQIVTCYGK